MGYGYNPCSVIVKSNGNIRLAPIHRTNGRLPAKDHVDHVDVIVDPEAAVRDPPEWHQVRSIVSIDG